MGLDTVELVLAVEKRFSITIPNDAAARLATVGQMHQFIVERLQHERPRELDRDEVYSILTEVICHQLGVRREDVTPEAHFVYDLGAD